MPVPSFIGIGMQKSGTRWLYQQLLHHPAFRMLPMKELHFFDEPFPKPKYVGQLERRAHADPAAGAFLARLQALEPSRNHGLATYFSLFEGTEGHLTGEITPDYAGLSAAMVDRLADAMPQTQIVMMLRDPIERAWSALNDGVNDGKFDAACLTDPVAMTEVLQRPYVQRVSYPGRTWRNWSRRFDMHHFFLEDVKDDPQAVLRAVLTALGADPAVPSALDAGFNSKAGRPRDAMSHVIRETLIAMFSDEIMYCAKVFGGRAQHWPARYDLNNRRKVAQLDRTLQERRASGEDLTFGQFYATTVLEQVKAGASHQTLGANLKTAEDWSSAGRLKYELLCNLSGVSHADARVVDYGCGSLRIGQHFIRALNPGHYLGLDVIPDFYKQGLDLLGPDLVAEKAPVLGVIGDPVAEDRAAAHGADLVFASAVAFHVHPDEMGQFARNIDRASARPGCIVLFDAMIHPEMLRYAHRGWAHPLDRYKALFPGLDLVQSVNQREEIRDGKTLSMQLLMFHRPDTV